SAFLFLVSCQREADSWIRINQIGYTPQGIKVAVWASKADKEIETFALIDAASGEAVFKGDAGKAFGAYGPFLSAYRLDFTAVVDTGTYYIKTADARSPEFRIAADVYQGAAD